MNRDKLEIIRSILYICKNGAKKSEIVYKSNLNFKSAGAYLDWLVNRKIITREDDSFKTTAKGKRLLSNLNSASTFLGLK
jgi:predicted transcriptional regulator